MTIYGRVVCYTRLMHGLILGIVLFLLASSLATMLQTRLLYSYAKHPFLFAGLFVAFLSGTLWSLDYMPAPLLVSGLVVLALVYIGTISLLVKYWRPMNNLYGVDTVPPAYQGLIQPECSGQVVKVFELVLQDTAAWLIVGGLLSLSHSLLLAAVLFTGIVFLLHIPGLWLFGRVYGAYFLVLVTLVAFLVPLLYQIDQYGFLYLYTLHIGGYITMYLLMGSLGSIQKRSA
jgi:hypothetical protein